jgi:hypothetical protein
MIISSTLFLTRIYRLLRQSRQLSDDIADTYSILGAIVIFIVKNYFVAGLLYFHFTFL